MAGEFHAWLNEQRIANLLSIPMLEADGYIISSHTKKDWVVFTPKGEKSIFKRDTGVDKSIPYIDLRTNKAGVVMIETVRNNFGSYAKKEIEKAKLSRNLQSMIGHPSNGHYAQIVSRNDLENCPVNADDVKMLKTFLVHIAQV